MPLLDNSTPLRLEGKTRDGSLWIVAVDHSPFSIGRKEGSSLFLASEGVSRKHAEILEAADGWVLRDCGSTNGTYINGKRLSGEHLLRQGDHLSIAEVRFDVVEFHDDYESTQIIDPYAEHLEQMLVLKSVDPHFQPVIALSDSALIGYEILGRTNHTGLPNCPRQLFDISRKLDRQVELSELFRNTAIENAAKAGVTGLVLFNTLPEEINLEILRPSLRALRKLVPDLKLGMELHENTITDVAIMKELRELLNEQEILLVYDDFGAGQSRLIELLDSVPDILKFDIAMIKNIQQRSDASRSMLETLVKMATDAGIRTLAEGVENIEEATACRAIGFELAQGYYFGHPAPLQSIDQFVARH
jgi:EAL domain-containing protein (putative c-di-GMP-specific phosphodiesterase class I)